MLPISFFIFLQVRFESLFNNSTNLCERQEQREAAGGVEEGK
jgi:hypothetical protein